MTVVIHPDTTSTTIAPTTPSSPIIATTTPVVVVPAVTEDSILPVVSTGPQGATGPPGSDANSSPFQVLAVQDTIPDTSLWAPDQFWYDTQKEATTGGRWRRWTGFAFIPARVVFSATGGLVTDVGGYRIHKFLSNDVIVFSDDGAVDVLWVAGGGGGSSGGGGAGGFIRTDAFPVLTGPASVVIGIGGAPGTTSAFAPGVNGTNTSFGGITAIGGGGGASPDDNGHDGASGGGAGASSSAFDRVGGLGLVGQGHNGGGRAVAYANVPYPAGGGGGAGGVGGDAPALTVSGDGGVGIQDSISGLAVWYAGGGGSMDYLNGGTPGAGGLGGGGNGGTPATAGVDGTGGGGGGTSNSGATGKRGGNGIVIIRYLL